MAELKAEPKEVLIRVKSSTDCNKLTGSIVAAHEQDKTASIKMRTIGAGALNQAIKGVIGANKHFGPKGVAVSLAPYFVNVENLDFKPGRESITAIEFKLNFEV